MNRLLSLLGLCRRAGRLVIGNDPVVDSVSNKKASLVLIANDTSDNTAKGILSICHRCDVKSYVLPYTKDEISEAVGKYCGVLSICDKGFSKKAIALLNSDITKEE